MLANEYPFASYSIAFHLIGAAFGLLALSLGGGTIDNRPFVVGVLPFALSVVNPVKGYACGVLEWNKDRSSGGATLVGDLLVGPKLR